MAYVLLHTVDLSVGFLDWTIFVLTTESSLDCVSEEVRGVLLSLISLMVSADFKPHL